MRRSSLVIVGLFVLFVSACVFPKPPPGVPVPDLVMTADKADPVAGPLTITATPVNVAPDHVEFTLDGGSPFAIDATPPYSVTIDTSTLRRGTHVVRATGSDGTYTVFQQRAFTTRPNIVVILVDDMDSFMMPLWGALPNAKAAIGNRGTTFTRAFAPDPLCCPARASLLTGDYPHNTGVFEYPEYHEFVGGAENDTVATRLHGAGYRTAFAGKYLNGYEKDPNAVPPGWDEWFGLAGDIHTGYNYSANHNGTVETFGSAPADYQTDVLASEAVHFLNSTESADDQPFFLYVTPTAPHAWIPPAPRDAANPFSSAMPNTPPNLNEADVSDKPEWIRDGVPLLDANALTTRVADYRRKMGSMLAVDDLVASIVTTLKNNGEYDSTTLMFLSDNGYNNGSHRLGGKLVPYEESIRIPFAIAGPGIPHATQTALVTQLDVTPTLLDLAGVAVPNTIDGRSLRPLFEGTSTWRQDFLLESSGKYHPFVVVDTIDQIRPRIAAGTFNPTFVPTWRAVRTDRYIYIQWYGGTYHDYELYDLVGDPWQLTNLLATPEGRAQYATLTVQLQARLDELSTCSGLNCR
jgi:arylsulfatase A-like enzyme